MGQPPSDKPVASTLDKVLGYLNFSSGQHDPNFFRNLDTLFRTYEGGQCEPTDLARQTAEPAAHAVTASEQGDSTPAWRQVHTALRDRLSQLKADSETYRDSLQVENVLNLVFEDFLPTYRLHHRDLLCHQTDDLLFNSFFVARVFETVLSKSMESESPHAIIGQSLSVINDHIGHRPVATLTSRKIEPYDNEWVRPIPLFIKDVGVAAGPYEQIARLTIEILRLTDPDILRAAQFNPDNLEELALDPRAFDFDHPVNKRPNHHFGSWDEHKVDNRGYYTRFIVHQVTIDALLERPAELADDPDFDATQTMFEAAAAMAGTMLMGSGISGGAPGVYDSSISLSSLLPRIAGYRDDFYRQLIARIEPEHRNHLLAEAERRKQVFGGVRQHLNAKLASCRAWQLVNCRLASIYARMGFPKAANEQSALVPIASARMICQIDCLLSEANRAIKERKLKEALQRIPEIKQLLLRGIQCGAIVDPWNMLGFDGNYSLFPAIENSVRDHRTYELVDLVECIMAVCSKLWSEAAALDDEDITRRIREEFSAFVDWWRKYAAHEVVSMDAVDGLDIFQAAELVAQALRLWHQGGAATGDISFWAEHAELFDSPKAYTLVIDALIQRKDYATAMALLVHWLSRANEIGLQQADSSFHNIAFRWIVDQKGMLVNRQAEAMHATATDDDCDSPLNDPPESSQGTAPTKDVEFTNTDSAETIWRRIGKFYDFVEANADEYWQVPVFDLKQSRPSSGTAEDFVQELNSLDRVEDDDEEENSIFSAAYENVTFNDSADDGNEGEIYDGISDSDEALEAEVDRVMDRLEFLGTVASYWRIAATIDLPLDLESGLPTLTQEQSEHLGRRLQMAKGWLRRARENYQQLTSLCDAISRYRIPRNGVDQDSMLQYDQNRLFKESLTDQAILTCVETENATRTLEAVVRAIEILLPPERDDASPAATDDSVEADIAKRLADVDEASPHASLVETYAGILLKDTDRILNVFDDLREYFNERTTLYVPLSKNGKPEDIVSARVTQTAMLDLMRSFPAIGLLTPTFELAQTALDMERNQPPVSGAVTEYDEMFEIAFSSMVESVVASTEKYETYLRSTDRPDSEVIAQKESVLFDCIEILTESALILWLRHSQTLRLSVMEKVHKKSSMQDTVEFIKTYGKDLFTQNFLHIGNIRAILHQGAEQWLTEVRDSHDPPDWKLLKDMGESIPMKKVVRHLTFVLEAVLENFNEYRDYNTTTTQSDNGQMLHIFFDFLILRSRYDRVCWNLNPVVWAHRILVRRQQTSVARMWRKSLKLKVGSESDRYLTMLKKLRQKHSIQMSSVGRRIEGRFSSEMQIDRLTALVKPAMCERDKKKSDRAFDMLRQEAHAFSKSTIGVGVDLPAWLASLENEVQQRLLPVRLRTQQTSQHWGQTKVLPIADIREQLESLPRRSPVDDV